MIRHIPAANWPAALADAINRAEDGDTILCHTKAMIELGRRAHARMCPDKTLEFPWLEGGSP